MRLTLAILHGFLGLSGIAAGLNLVRDPSGKAMGMDQSWLAGSPFADFRTPGLFLASVIAGANLASAVLLLRRHRRARLASLGTGLLLVTWLAIQTRIIGLRHWSQGIWWTLFPLVALLAALLTEPEQDDDEFAPIGGGR